MIHINKNIENVCMYVCKYVCTRVGQRLALAPQPLMIYCA
jgi:hypothetical protein